jgi:hypothetical protein
MISEVASINKKKEELFKFSKQLEIKFSKPEYDEVVIQLGQLELEWQRILTQIRHKFHNKLLPYSWFHFDFETKSIFMTLQENT